MREGGRESALPVDLGAFALKIPKKSFEELNRTKWQSSGKGQRNT